MKSPDERYGPVIAANMQILLHIRYLWTPSGSTGAPRRLPTNVGNFQRGAWRHTKRCCKATSSSRGASGPCVAGSTRPAKGSRMILWRKNQKRSAMATRPTSARSSPFNALLLGRCSTNVSQRPGTRGVCCEMLNISLTASGGTC